MALTLITLFLSAVISSTVYYIISAILILMVLVGIYLMSKVETAVLGNRLGAIAMFLAIVLTLWYHQVFGKYGIGIGVLLCLVLGVGTVLGSVLAVKVKMIEMPQTVGLLNGFGGLASMIAGILTVIGPAPEQYPTFSYITAGLAIVVGGLTWTGSAIAAGKLQKLINQRPVVHKNHQFWTLLFLIISIVAALLFGLPLFQEAGAYRTILVLVAIAAGNLFGYFLAIRVGGADMPITISLLNSLSGVAGSIAGMAIGDMLLVAVGGVVGASGLLLTQIMCRSMNRQLMDILLGKTSAPAQAKAATAEEVPAEESKAEAQAEDSKVAAAKTAPESPSENSADWLKQAEKVILVPGYGMALSQAQPLIKQITDQLEADGKEVKFAIHPVAGRMPGHMNVLLAEVDIPYDKLYEMDAINDQFKDTDLVMVIGANDVVNPAANTAEDTPIYGMPVLNVGDAPHVLIFNFDDKPGYAGVDNPLYKEAEESDQHVRLHLGDAKATLGELFDEYRKSDPEAAPGTDAKEESSASPLAQWLREAENVIIVPGYGMALSQAQPLVKQLADRLEADGKSVKFAIHPVAGRMPGHMNVLLAEVDIPYEKLHEMQEINDEFAQTDLVLVIGANDVVNPAANTAEGTPIYGMPVLDIGDAKHIVIMNYDDKPGYAGVDNPLYAEAEASSEHVLLLLGDAKDSLNTIFGKLKEEVGAATEAGDVKSSSQTASEWVKGAESIIIVPGYGMALSQAQPLVKQLADRLEAEGKSVRFAIHPVAGRMPGHMNVLLAEVDVPYEKLHEMQEINDDFAQTDLVFVIGANDVVNPAANTAEGTPIYGMPVLNVGDAEHLIIMNYDDKPGYAGVDNPLYAEAEASSEHVILLLGDAKASLTELMDQVF